MSTPPAPLSAFAACPGTSHVVGGGVTPASQVNKSAEFWINGSRPYDGPDADRLPDDGWVGRAFNRFGHDKVMAVFAICRGRAARYPTRNVPLRPGSAAVARATCPAGTHVSAGGASVSGPAAEAYLSSSAPFDSSQDADALVDDGWTATGFNDSGGPKRLVVYASCITNLPTYTAQPATSADALLFNACPAGTHGMGGGLSVTAPPGLAFLNALYPYAQTTNPPDAGFVSAAFTRGLSRAVTGYSICKT